MIERHLSRAEWLALLEPRLANMSPGTREALLSGNTAFEVSEDGVRVRYTTDSVRPVVGPTHMIHARVDSLTEGARKDYVQ